MTVMPTSINVMRFRLIIWLIIKLNTYITQLIENITQLKDIDNMDPSGTIPNSTICSKTPAMRIMFMK